MRIATSVLLLLPLAHPLLALKAHDFKTCSQSAFCRRGRALAERAPTAGSSWHSPYTIVPSSVALSSSASSFTSSVKSELYPDINFELEVRIHEDGVVRVRMDEVKGLRKRYDEASSWALVREPSLKNVKDVKWVKGKNEVKGVYDDVEVRVQYQPLKVSLWKGGREEVVLNGKELLHMEHFRVKEEKKEPETAEGGAEQAEQAVLQAPARPTAWFEGEEEDGLWAESFSTWTDQKPKGPESLSLDIHFPGHANVYGIPQHASPLSLPTTTGPSPHYTDPYRLYNLDVFEYLADSPMSLYGSIPFLHAHSAESTVGIFNAIASETWIDVSHPTEDSTLTHWVSESGILDVFLLPGPTPEDVFKQYARLTGTSAMPAHWALGYHQCRWNYISSEDVRSVQKRFDEDDFPLDVLWLDIEYSEEHKYFIWDAKNFPDPVAMVNDVAALGRKMVVIVDPHLKRVSTYPVYEKAKELDVLVKGRDGKEEYEGWCWSGSSAWVDFFHPGSWDWWKSLFRLTDGKDKDSWRWVDSTENVHIWNDMNEPSVFNGPEITMPKDNVHYGGWEHRDIHNINGMLFQNLTSQAITTRGSTPKRPFVLSRSFYAGSQRLSAIWTGDNMGSWEHMAVGIPMVLSNGIAGMTFAGADVGGFFGNPDPEMLVRWYQVGIFAPFFRAHAHIDTKRREPYLLEEPHKSIVRDVIRLRYSLLSVWYTSFRRANADGVPILRPHWVMFPKDKKGFAIDDQYFIGDSGLLVKPVTKPGATETQVYIPEDQVYYDYFTYNAYRGSAAGKTITVSSPLEKIPLFIRGGSIVPTRARPRRSSPLMKKDPFTLTVALSQAELATGELYLDDGESFDHQKGDLVWRKFDAWTLKAAKRTRMTLKSSDMTKSGQTVVDGSLVAPGAYRADNAYAKSVQSVRVEKLVILGLPKKPTTVIVQGVAQKEGWTWEGGVAADGKKEGGASVLVIKNPNLKIVDDWLVEVEF